MILITKTPTTWRGALLELAVGFVSRSIVVDDHWYVFRRGRGLLRLPASQAIGEQRRVSDIKPGPDDLVGSTWSFHNNCLTVFEPYWRDSMSSAAERNATVRAILTAMGVSVLALIGAGTVVYVTVVEPLKVDIGTLRGDIDAARRAEAAHYGILKKLIEGTHDGDE